MRRIFVIRVGISLLLLGAGGLRAREIPVYREYTRPVRFYDDRGQAVSGTAQGPDRVALRSLRDSKAQEVYLGKATILDLGFESGDSVFASERPPVAMPASMTGGDESRRSRRESSGQNWLAGSLSLPTLGQTARKATSSSMSPGSSESMGWGWLADEMSGQADGEIPPPEGMLSEEDWNPILSQEASMKGASDSYTPSSSSSSFSVAVPRGSVESAGAFPEEERAAMMSREGSSYKPPSAASREWAGEGHGEASRMRSYAAPSAMAELSQTRAVISDWSVGARPDFSSVATVGIRDDGTGSPFRSAPGVSSSTMGGSSRSRGENSSSLGLSPGGGRPSSGSSSWRGGWSANPVGAGRPSQFQRLSDPVLDPVVPASSYERSKPTTSSGGYKPAWY